MKLVTSKIYLSRRNLLALLSKLDRAAAGEETHCTIVKYQPGGSAYRQTMKAVSVIAVQDEDYYVAQNRPAGEMHPADEAHISAPSTGVHLPDSIF
jgi:hypothetical protein